MSIFGKETDIRIAGELHTEKVRTNNSLLLTVVEKLEQRAKGMFEKDTSHLIFFGAYFSFLARIRRAEMAIASGQDFIGMTEEEYETSHPGLYNRGMSILTGEEQASAKTESVLQTQQDIELLKEDQSGFALVAHRRRMFSDSPNPLLKEMRLGFIQAAWDYTNFYLIGAQAGLGPMPKELTSSH